MFNKKLKRFTALALSSLLVLSAVSCGGNKNTDGSATNTPPTAN